ncbi:MAG: fasciclin domain-containing protein, partial [Pseudomonadota bacterium]
ELTVASGDGVTVDNARVVKTDIVADNGVIHVIDSVVLPK